jgi:hypothetical protein
MGFIMDLSARLGIPVWSMILILVWCLVWKGLALWKSARLNQPIWFVVFMIVTAAGVLEIPYIYLFSKMGSRKR